MMTVGPSRARKGITVIPLAASTVLLAVVAVIVHSQRRPPTDTIRVRVGDPPLAFEALTADGARFHSDALMGQRVLLNV